MFSEEIAAVNLAKFRKVQTELGKFRMKIISYDDFCFVEESAERADTAENQLGKLRTKARSTVSVERSGSVVCSLYLTYVNYYFFFLARNS